MTRSERVISEAETTIRWLLSGHPDAKAQAFSWLAAYGAEPQDEVRGAHQDTQRIPFARPRWMDKV